MNDKPIYALSGYAEWFWIMAKGWKDVENREWSLSNKRMNPHNIIFPARIYLHASRSEASDEELEFILDQLNPAQNEEFNAVDWFSLRGKIIGDIILDHQVIQSASRWFFGKYGFLVRDGKLYENPIPCRGQLGFFKPEIQGV